jgi:hypothetical protein
LNLVLADIAELSYFPNVVSGNGFQDVRAKHLWEYAVGGKKKGKKKRITNRGGNLMRYAFIRKQVYYEEVKHESNSTFNINKAF